MPAATGTGPPTTGKPCWAAAWRSSGPVRRPGSVTRSVPIWRRTRSCWAGSPRFTGSAASNGCAEPWQQAADRWHDTSTLTRRVRGSVRANLLKVGRWLAVEHPEVADPAAWTRQTCATWIAALDRMRVGDFVQRTTGLGDRL